MYLPAVNISMSYSDCPKTRRMEDKSTHSEAEEWGRDLPFKRVESQIDRDALWQRIEGSVATQKPRVRRLVPAYVAVAAAAAIALLWFFVFAGGNMVRVESPVAQSLETLLPDQSEVILNAGSRLSYSEKKWEAERKVELSGEAFFRVEKGALFTVETDLGTVRVLGTQFNVYAWKDQFRVVCTEGSVAVTHRDVQETLRAGEAVKLIGERQLQKEAGQDPAWIRGEFSFDNEPLWMVVDEVERQFGLQVRIDPGLANEAITTQFVRGDPTDILDKIAYTLGLAYTIEGEIVRYYSE
jgi:transmembrane sensor